MASFNSCSFIGTAGADPIVKTFDSGNKVCNLNIAVNERYSTRDGEQRENTEWIPLVFNGNLAEIAEKYIRKGSLIFVSGKFRTRQWEDRNGEKHYATEINVRELQLLSKKDEREESPAPRTSYRQPEAPASRPAAAPATNDDNGDLPF